MMIYFKRRVSSFADSLESLNATSSSELQNEINDFLNCLWKRSFLLAEYTPVQRYRTQNYSIRASATSPNPFRTESTNTASPDWSDCRIIIPSVSATAMPSVSGVTRWGGTGWFNYDKALDEPYKVHFACSCIRPEVNQLLCSA